MAQSPSILVRDAASRPMRRTSLQARLVRGMLVAFYVWRTRTAFRGDQYRYFCPSLMIITYLCTRRSRVLRRAPMEAHPTLGAGAVHKALRVT